MRKLDITELYLYRWRYWIGYGLVAVGLILALVFISLYLPGGLSKSEIQSVVKSDTISFANIGNFDVINLPYYLLQKTSLKLFGVSILSIKLPSIILAFLSAIGMVLLLKLWFKPNVGVLASLIAITTGQFLFIAQNGTPDILYLLWPVWLILLASMTPQSRVAKSICVISLCVVAALSLYTPLSIYVLLALAGAIIFHPHLRYLIRQLPRTELIMGAIISFIILTPLMILIIKSPNIISSLLGIPAHWPDLRSNISLLGAQYLGFANPGQATLMTPFFELGSMLIIVIGVYYTAKNISTAKSYIATFWIICLIPVVILNPSFTSITFLPLVLLLASGLNYLLTYWYSLFPLNPYARIAGLVPVVVLVIVLILSGTDRYLYAYRYDPNITYSFSTDLILIPNNTKMLVVSSEELSFYQVVAKHNKNITVSTLPTGDIFLATRSAKQKFIGYDLDKIITTSDYNQADRFYLYKKSVD